jgi:hypothetical protein
MPRPVNSPSKTFTTSQRGDSKTFQITLNPLCGLPERICKEWQRRSFKCLPDELADYRYPKSKAEAKSGAIALIDYLKRKKDEGSARRISAGDIAIRRPD